jgi:hypothetical protein
MASLISGQVRVALTLSILAVAGCGDGGSDTAPPPVGTLAEQAETMLARLDRNALFNTGFTGQPGEMPVTGTAEFQGFAGLAVGAAGPGDLTGRARLTVDFGAKTLTGSATGFEAENAGSPVAYNGTLAFLNGTIGQLPSVPGSVPNDIRFRYEGTLTGPGTEVVVASDATGKFRGTPIKGMLAASASTAAAVARVDGVEVPAPFALVAEIQP